MPRGGIYSGWVSRLAYLAGEAGPVILQDPEEVAACAVEVAEKERHHEHQPRLEPHRPPHVHLQVLRQCEDDHRAEGHLPRDGVHLEVAR
eukprot:3095636-Pyramimonas_sp.AAC.1